MGFFALVACFKPGLKSGWLLMTTLALDIVDACANLLPGDLVNFVLTFYFQIFME